MLIRKIRKEDIPDGCDNRCKSTEGYLVTVLRSRRKFTTVNWLEEKEALSGCDHQWHQGRTKPH